LLETLDCLLERFALINPLAMDRVFDDDQHMWANASAFAGSPW
jgi:hypothetical protein